MTLMNDKYQYLKQKFDLGELPLGKHEFPILCEFCQRKVTCAVQIGRNGRCVYLWALIHHKDGNKENNDPSNFQLSCYECHKRFHDWGIIQRWLKKIGKKVEDLPDSTNLKAMWKSGWQ